MHAQLLEPGSVYREHVADIARVGGDLSAVHEFARSSFQRVLQAFLISLAGPEREHACTPIREKPRSECTICVQRTRNLANNLPEESLACFTGDAFLNAAQQLESVEF